MGRKVQIGIGTPDDMGRRFVAAWHRAQAGESEGSVEHITFDSLETLLRVLTPRRWDLLKTLRRGGGMSIRALSKTLGRDYKNVHSDVSALEAVGLIDRADNGLIRVPWDEIDAHMQLAA